MEHSLSGTGSVRTLEAVRRPLKDGERRLIRARIGNLRQRGRRSLAATAPIAGGTIFVLWLLTILASDAPWLVVTGFWLAAGTAITLWARRDMVQHERDLDAVATRLHSALEMNAADVYDVRARSFAEFEEVEDEGACYAFELSDDRLVFIVGQEFYESARFPSLDFSLVYVLDEKGRSVDLVIDKRAPKTAPARKIAASLKGRYEMPEHLEVRSGTVANVEQAL